MDYKKYFDFLNEDQIKKLEALPALYKDWNEKINLISRKDIDNVEERHILHSLSIVKYLRFKENAVVLDLGTGGGFPGVPLAIVFPDTKFVLLDARNKKLLVINDIVEKLNITNVKTVHARIEDHKDQYDFIVTRAVASMSKLLHWTKRSIKTKQVHATPNGLIALKGGDLRKELKEMPKGNYVDSVSIDKLLGTNLYPEKKLLYLQG